MPNSSSELVGSEDSGVSHLEVGFAVFWLVHLVADELEDVSESFLVLDALGSLGQLEVNLGEVHAHGLRNESFK